MNQVPPQNDRLRNWIGSLLVVIVLSPIFPFWIIRLPVAPFDDPHGSLDDKIVNQAQLNTLHTAVIQYKKLNRQFPTTEQGLAVLVAPTESVRVKRRFLAHNHILDLWGNPYQYSSPSARRDKAFDIWSLGPDGVNGTEDDIHAEFLPSYLPSEGKAQEEPSRLR